MKLQKAIALFTAALTLLAALTLTGCTQEKEPAAMIVNDVEVPQGVMNYYINYGKDYLVSYGIDINDQENNAQLMSMIEEQGVDIVKEIAVIRSLARDAGLTVSSDTLAQSLAQEKAYFDDDAAWQEWLTTYQITESDVEWLLEYQLLADSLYEQVNQELTLTDEQVAEIYNAAPENYDAFKFAHILVTPAGDDDAAWAAAEQTAQEVLQQINDGSVTFEDMAAQYNSDSTKATGGDLGQYVNKNNSPYVEDFSEAAFSLTEVGTIYPEPVRSPFGYHLIKLLDKTSGAEAARDTIIDEQLGQQRYENYSNHINEALANAVITQDYQRQYTVSADGADNTDNTGDNTDNADNNNNQ